MAPIEKGLPGQGLLAHVVVNKYGDHLPLHRQEAIFQRQGVALSRKTMCDWMGECAELVSPLYERMKQNILGSKVMQTDDTPANVLDPSLPRARIGPIWTYFGDRDYPYTVYAPSSFSAVPFSDEPGGNKCFICLLLKADWRTVILYSRRS